MGNRGVLILSQYTGSKSLSFLCNITSLSIDQVNFIACQFAALLLSYILRKHIRDPKSRLIYCMVCGVFICNFCFGIQILHVIISAGLSYFIIKNVKSSYMPWCVFTVSMSYLAWLHLRRQFYQLADGYSLDITGPMMVMTQKVTSLAFAVGDGNRKRKDKEITELQTIHAISDAPESLEFWSFIFQFQSMLAGPLVFFKDFREFIYSDTSPSPLGVVLKKIGGSIFFALLYIKIAPSYNIENLRDEEFLENFSTLNKLLFINLATSLERTKYYHAWILSDAVCNASGLGYNSRENKWDLVTNVDAIKFELGLNLKESLDQWNKGTMRWLRYVIYERFNSNVRTFLTYATSALWHGFWPGYYITFFSGALFTSSARTVRRFIRPLFLSNIMAKRAYDFATWLTTRIVISYVSFTFILLDFIPSIQVYMKLYFFLHVAAVCAMVFLPKISKNVNKRTVLGNGSLSKANTNNKIGGPSNGKLKQNSFPSNDTCHTVQDQVDDNEIAKLKTR